MVGANNKDSSADVVLSGVQTPCKHTTLVTPASEDFVGLMMRQNDSILKNISDHPHIPAPPTASSRHSSRKSPLQPIPVAPLEVVTVPSETAEVRAADRITVDLFTGDVYVDNRPLRELIGGMRLSRRTFWREEPSLVSF